MLRATVYIDEVLKDKRPSCRRDYVCQRNT